MPSDGGEAVAAARDFVGSLAPAPLPNLINLYDSCSSFDTQWARIMYFVLSKVGWLLLQPSTLLFTATLIGALLMATPLARFGRRLALIAGSLLAICALTPLCVVIVRPLENRFPARSLDAIANPTGIIALGAVTPASSSK